MALKTYTPQPYTVRVLQVNTPNLYQDIQPSALIIADINTVVKYYYVVNILSQPTV